jgi:Tfp pilus assembly protein PilN
VDLKQEIKLSDLFRRRPKAGDGDAAPEAEPKKKPKKRLFERKPKEPKAEKPPKPEKPKKARQRGKEPKVAAKEALPLPQIPLMRAFNLLQHEEARDKGSRLGVAQVAVALGALLVIGALGSAYIFMSGRVTDRQTELDSLNARLSQLQVPDEDTGSRGSDAALVSEADARRQALAAALTGRIAWDRILRQLSLVLPENVYLFQLSAGNGAASAAPTSESSLTISGTAESQADVAKVLGRLSVLPEFESVKLQSSTRQQDDAGTGYAFVIAVTIGSPGAAP